MALADFSWRENLIRSVFGEPHASLYGAQADFFRDADLVAMVWHFAADQETMLSLLRVIRERTDDREVAAWVSDIIAWQTRVTEAFAVPAPGVVFEVHVKMSPTAWDESCLCTTYEGACAAIRSMVRACTDLYMPENASSRYRIIRRPVLSDADADRWGEMDCYEDEAVFLPGLKLYRVSMYEPEYENERTCGHDCNRCQENMDMQSVDCYSVSFPPEPEVWVPYGLCRWVNPCTGAERFVMIFEEEVWRHRPGDQVCVIPLDSDYVCHRRFDEDFWDHEHIEPPFLIPADSSELSADMRADYEALREAAIAQIRSCTE